MRHIYKNASTVAMWIGEEHSNSAKAIELIRMLSSSYTSGNATQLADSIREERSPVPTGSFAALALLMERPYWTRVWVLQEIAMGNRSTPILCGTHVITWGELFDALYSFANTCIDLLFTRIDCEYASNKGLRRNHIIQLHGQQEIQMKSKKMELLPILDVARRCSVTDAKDRIYGILGMIPRNIFERMTIDYSQSVEEIYRSFAKATILARRF